MAFEDGGYEQGPRAATKAMPEPGSVGNVLIALSTVLMVSLQRRT